MGKGNTSDDELSCQKYGVPLYGAAWVPPAAAAAAAAVETEVSSTEPETPASYAVDRHIVLAGGGGEGRSGIPNALLLSTFDFDSSSLSVQPVAKLGTGSDLPYRIAVHPGGEGLICSFPKSCRWFEWDLATSTDEHTLNLKSSEKVLEQLEDVGQQLAMTFNFEGSLLAVGGEDGKLRVFKWSTMESILNEANAHPSVKDLDFSPDGKFLVSVGVGPGRIWNVATSTSIALLPNENNEVFGFCRFSRTSDTDQVLYITAMRDKGCSIVKWNTTSWNRISSTHIVRDPVSAFNVSPDGKLLAIGTIQGDIFIVSSASMRLQTVVRKAHLVLVTALAFSRDSRALVSASPASSARVTLIKDKKKDGTSLWIILFIILLAIAVYYAKSKEFFPLKP
ncbi:Prolactin regulatory element-binding protein/Protein transport protein SEC12p [Handroanthus impetiginosus]|uniref:Prolactin regulatory element-binding protein/Protein transport protein SEC12p n=1 Tax=Handroanthus impetiginosus TaxID=429701 RepID=A0A2G9GB61_9LAMI|nr:Prolactin regulatory element-binding protein/Protein transport protein SEC12p [Handroanthus impetiginosus]